MTVDWLSAHALRAGAALAVAAVGGIAACGTPTQLHVQDNGQVIGSVRAVHRFGEGPGGPGIELEASRARARGSQALAATETATLDRRSVTGPTTLHHDARVDHAQIVYNHLMFAGRPVEMEWFAGAAWVQTRWDAESTTATDARLASRTRWYGPAGGVLGRVRLGPLLALEGRYTGAARSGGAADSGSRYEAELALALRPAPGLVLRGGFAESRSWVRANFDESEQSVRARGPYLNLGLEF
jgi:hypothetical protein